MTLFTPNFLLPYPSGGDEPCDFPQQWCEFTEAANAVMAQFQSTVDRTVPVIPIARLELTTPLAVVANDNITFDTLSVNTAGWVDFDVDPAGITINQGGRFAVTGNAHIQPSPVVSGNYVGVSVVIGNTAFNDTTRDRQTTVMGVSTGGIQFINTSTRITLNCIQTGATLVQPTFNSACLTVWWHADTATP